VHHASKGAIAAVEKAGGSVKMLRPPKPEAPAKEAKPAKAEAKAPKSEEKAAKGEAKAAKPDEKPAKPAKKEKPAKPE
jgi:hypothetical protein